MCGVAIENQPVKPNLKAKQRMKSILKMAAMKS